MPDPTTREDFAALIRRTGLTVSEPVIDELHTIWPYYERMFERLRNPARGREAEPAHIFRAEGTL